MNSNVVSFAKGIELTIKDLESGVPFDWFLVGKCNCGLVIKNMLTKEEFDYMIDKKTSTWTDRVKAFTSAGTWKMIGRDLERVEDPYLKEIWEKLKKSGLGIKEINQLEDLSDESILDKMQVDKKEDKDYYLNRGVVVRYFNYPQSVA